MRESQQVASYGCIRWQRSEVVWCSPMSLPSCFRRLEITAVEVMAWLVRFWPPSGWETPALVRPMGQFETYSWRQLFMDDHGGCYAWDTTIKTQSVLSGFLPLGLASAVKDLSTQFHKSTAYTAFSTQDSRLMHNYAAWLLSKTAYDGGMARRVLCEGLDLLETKEVVDRYRIGEETENVSVNTTNEFSLN